MYRFEVMSFPDLVQRAFRPDADGKQEYVVARGRLLFSTFIPISLCTGFLLTLLVPCLLQVRLPQVHGQELPQGRQRLF